MISMLLLSQLVPKQEAVWNLMQVKLAKAKEIRVEFETRELGTKRLVYSGSFSYKRKKVVKFEYTDHVEGCQAGADDDSTWVSPSEFRGYNDTVTQRQPYIIVSLAKGVQALDSPLDLDKPVTRVGNSEQIQTKDGTKFLIDSRKSLINQIEGQDTGFSQIVTSFTYKKVI